VQAAHVIRLYRFLGMNEKEKKEKIARGKGERERERERGSKGFR